MNTPNRAISSDLPTLLITGGTGFLGKALLPLLVDAGYTGYVLTRSPEKQAAAGFTCVSRLDQIPDPLPTVIINLAGESIAASRWSEDRKRALLDSRVGVTKALLNLYKRRNQKPERVLSGSAVGIYSTALGDQDQSENEVDAAQCLPQNFSQELCCNWEVAAHEFISLGAQVCSLRIGPVLGQGGGMMQQLLPPFRLGLGGPIGGGNQWLSWIHRDDLCRAIEFLLSLPKLPRAVNLTAPAPVTNGHFTVKLGHALHRPAFFRMPSPIVKLLWGQMGQELLLSGQKVLPNELQALNFNFQYPTLEQALHQVVG